MAHSFKREAIASVLTRLGESMFVMLKLTLAQDHKINIDKDESYKLEDLHLALQKIVGPHGASLLIREVRDEIDLLSKQQLH
jgi:hypothetical protein